MQDELLGLLTPSAYDPTCLAGQIHYQGRPVACTLCPEDDDLAPCLALAHQVVAALPEHDLRAKNLAAHKLLATYNAHWREYQEVDANGNQVDVSNPVLSAAEFMERIALTELRVTDHGCCFGYADGDLFAGHSIFVESLHGCDFADFHVELLG